MRSQLPRVSRAPRGSWSRWDTGSVPSSNPGLTRPRLQFHSSPLPPPGADQLAAPGEPGPPLSRCRPAHEPRVQRFRPLPLRGRQKCFRCNDAGSGSAALLRRRLYLVPAGGVFSVPRSPFGKGNGRAAPSLLGTNSLGLLAPIGEAPSRLGRSRPSRLGSYPVRGVVQPSAPLPYLRFVRLVRVP